MNKFINKEIYYSVTLLCVPLIVLFSIYFFSYSSRENVEFATPQPALVIETNYLSNPFAGIDINAKAAIVQDLNTGKIIYEKNSNTKVPLASLTKLMTALVIYEDVENLDQRITIPNNIFEVEGNTDLIVGETFILKEFIDWVLLTSSNHGSVAISNFYESIFVGQNFIERMNSLSEKIGLEHTFFLNETGLDEDLNTAGSFGTAKDISILLKYILHNHSGLTELTTIDNYVQTSGYGLNHFATNTNTITRDIKGIIASKTGFTDLAGGNLAVAVDQGLNTPISIIVLGSSRNGRFEDVLKLNEILTKYTDYQIK